MCSCLRGVSRWFTPLACGPGHPELSKSYMDMASKLFTFALHLQAAAATTRIRQDGNAASNTASARSDPEHTRKRSSRRRVVLQSCPSQGFAGIQTADSQCGAICVP